MANSSLVEVCSFREVLTSVMEEVLLFLLFTDEYTDEYISFVGLGFLK